MVAGDLNIRLSFQGWGRRKHKRLWAVTTLFNPAGYRSLWDNYKRFAEHMEASGVNLLTAELTYPGQRPALRGRRVRQYQAHSVMWHKERLLNLAIEQLPDSCDQVAWVDADILFTNQYWADDTSTVLGDYPVTQLFEKVILMDSQGNHYRDAYGFAFSRACGFLDDPNQDRYNGYWHGNLKHPGFAWAARREVIKEWGGLYDYHILGGGDFQIALSVIGDADDHWYGRFGPAFRQHMLTWAERCHRVTGGKLGYVPGCILHMWHGHSEDRQYVERTRCLVEHQFDPAADLKLDANGLWAWNTAKAELHQKVADYFGLRNDDRCFPIHPTRYEDKYPIVYTPEGGDEKIREVLRALAGQRRRDFVLQLACHDWQHAKRIRHTIRDEYWPYEIRVKSSYNQPAKLVPKRLQLLNGTRHESRSAKAVLIDGGTVVGPDFVSLVTRPKADLVLDGRGKPVCVSMRLARATAVLTPDAAGEERLLSHALRTGMSVVTLPA